MRHAIALALLVATAGTARAQYCHSNLMIVLDRSCSMNMPPNPGPGMTKWVLAVAAINKLTTKYKGKLDFGLIMFPDETTPDNCKQDGNIYVTVGPDKEMPIATELARAMPTGPCTTPIKPGIDQVLVDPVYKTPFAGAGRRSFVLFISDGKETCGGGENEIVTSIAGLYTSGYPTYVVGFGGGVDPAGLTKFSTAGGVPRNTMGADAGALNYYQADDATQLEAALDAIAGEIVFGEFGTCPGTPCPDGRCFVAGEACIDGSCIGPAPDGGGGTGDGGGNGNGDGGGNGAGGGSGGCGCRIGDPAIGPGLGILFAIAAALGLAARRRRR